MLTELHKRLATYHLTGFLSNTVQEDFIHNCTGMPISVVLTTQLLHESSNFKDLFDRRQSEFMWLLVLNSDQTEAVLSDLHIEFDSNFFVALPSSRGTIDVLEAYRVGRGYPLVTNKFCEWCASRYICSNDSIRERRKDLMGYNMKVGVLVEWPSLYFSNKTHCKGHMCEVWEVLSQRLNVTYSFEESDLYGGRSVNGSWGGLVGQLLEGNVDIALALLTLTPARHRAVDFLLPLSVSRELILIQEPSEEELAWGSFLLPFDRWLWLGTAAVMAATWAVLRVQWRYRAGTVAGRREDNNQTYSDALHVAGIFLMQGRGEGCDTRSRDSVRATLLVASMSALLVYTAYCGALTASLATRKLKLPFTDLEGLLRDGSYQLLLQDASGEMSIFHNSSDPLLTTIYENLVVKENIPVCNKDIFDMICHSYKSAAMVYNDLYRAYKDQMKCSIVSAQDYIRVQLGPAVRKRSPYRELINYHLLQIRSEGVMQRLFRKHWSSPENQEGRESLKAVSVSSVVPVLAILGAAALLSLCLLLLERKLWGRPTVQDAATSTDSLAE